MVGQQLLTPSVSTPDLGRGLHAWSDRPGVCYHRHYSSDDLIRLPDGHKPTPVAGVSRRLLHPCGRLGSRGQRARGGFGIPRHRSGARFGPRSPLPGQSLGPAPAGRAEGPRIRCWRPRPARSRHRARVASTGHRSTLARVWPPAPARGPDPWHRRRPARHRARPRARAPPLARVALMLASLIRGGVLDPHPGPLSQDHRRLLIGFGELLATVLLGQIQVPPHLAPDQHGDTEKRARLRMPGRNAVTLTLPSQRRCLIGCPVRRLRGKLRVTPFVGFS